MENLLVDFRSGSLSAFRFRKLLGERVKESPVETVREFIASSKFATAPPMIRSLTLQRLSEASPAFVRSLLEATSPPEMNEAEIHILLGTHAVADIPGFAFWINSLNPNRQLALARELATCVVSEPSRVAAIMGTLNPETAQRVTQHALHQLKSNPPKLLTFTAELPATQAQSATLQGLTLALSVPHVAKGFQITQHPRVVSLIHDSIRSREDAAPYRELLTAEGIAESLPQGVARSLGFELLFQHLASIHLETALLRLSKLPHPADREYATFGVIKGCAQAQPLRALELAASLSSDSPRRHDALLLAAYAARDLDASITRHWLSSAPLSRDERTLLTGASP